MIKKFLISVFAVLITGVSIYYVLPKFDKNLFTTLNMETLKEKTNLFDSKYKEANSKYEEIKKGQDSNISNVNKKAEKTGASKVVSSTPSSNTSSQSAKTNTSSSNTTTKPSTSTSSSSSSSSTTTKPAHTHSWRKVVDSPASKKQVGSTTWYACNVHTSYKTTSKSEIEAHVAKDNEDNLKYYETHDHPLYAQTGWNWWTEPVYETIPEKYHYECSCGARK